MMRVKEREHLGDLGVDGTVALKLILKEEDIRLRTGFIWYK
jgi:hypothetical protein